MSNKEDINLDDLEEIDNLNIDDLEDEDASKKEKSKNKSKKSKKQQNKEDKEKILNTVKQKIFDDVKKIYSSKSTNTKKSKSKYSKSKPKKSSSKYSKSKKYIPKEKITDSNQSYNLFLVLILLILLIGISFLFFKFSSFSNDNAGFVNQVSAFLGLDMNHSNQKTDAPDHKSFIFDFNLEDILKDYNGTIGKDNNISDQDINNDQDIIEDTNDDFVEYNDLDNYMESVDDCEKAIYTYNNTVEVPLFLFSIDYAFRFITYGYNLDNKCIVYMIPKKMYYFVNSQQEQALLDQNKTLDQINEQLEGMNNTSDMIINTKNKCLLESDNNYFEDIGLIDNNIFGEGSYSIDFNSQENITQGNGYICKQITNKSSNLECELNTGALLPPNFMLTGVSFTQEVFDYKGSSDDVIWDLNASSVISLSKNTGSSVEINAENPGIVKLTITDTSIDNCKLEFVIEVDE